MQGSRWDRIFDNLIASLAAIDGTADVSTTVSSDSASGQNILNVTSSTNFVLGRSIIIDRASTNSKNEVAVVTAKGAGTLTLDTNLEFAHTAVEASTVEQGWYNNDIGANSVRSWDSLWSLEGLTTAGAAVSAKMASSSLMDHVGPKKQNRRLVLVAVFGQTSNDNPVDQENDKLYESFYSDIERAIEGPLLSGGAEDRTPLTRGGWAMNSIITSHRPIDPVDFDIPEKAPARMGILLEVQIDAQHRKGDTYA